VEPPTDRPLEKEYQHSLDSAVASFDFEGIHVNLIDTPGFPDFRGPTLTGMAATETTAVVINARNGIELSTRRLMRRAQRRRLCRIVVVNKIDQPGVDLEQLVKDIQEEFGDTISSIYPRTSRCATAFSRPRAKPIFCLCRKPMTPLLTRSWKPMKG
jgi:translation elongation factor EF-G